MTNKMVLKVVCSRDDGRRAVGKNCVPPTMVIYLLKKKKNRWEILW